MTASLVFLTPFGALVAAACVVPLLALLLAGSRVARARRRLGLRAAPRARQLPKILALVAIPVLLGLAAAQPALRSSTSARIRTDAQAMFVIDVSRSMLAAGNARSPTRLARAKRAALELRAAIPGVPSGIATLTDRVLPDLLPVSDLGVFDNTIERAVGIEQPPPANQNVIATSLAPIGALGTQNYFPATVKRRLVVVLTDGESRPFDGRQVAKQLATGPGVRLVLVHVWAPGEGIFVGNSPESSYHENPASSQALDSLASAAGGRAYGEHSIGSAISAERAALGSGPTIVEGRNERTRTLAPYLALAALLPLALLLLPGTVRRRRRASRAVLRPTGAAQLSDGRA